MLSLSNSPLFLKEHCSTLYQDRAHHLFLLATPELATPLARLMFTLKALPQDVAAPAWLKPGSDHYQRLEQLLAYCAEHGMWQPECTYCVLLNQPHYDQNCLRSILSHFYPEHEAFTYRSILPTTHGPELDYVRPEELDLVETALHQQLPDVTRHQLPARETLRTHINAGQVLALRASNGSLAGVVHFELNGHDLYVAHLFKIPGTSMRSVLPQLVALAQRECAQRKLKKVYLYHLKHNDKLAALYEAAGLMPNQQFDLTYYLPQTQSQSNQTKCLPQCRQRNK